MSHVQRDPALARVLVVELPAHVRIGHALERRRCPIARGATADRRHRRHACVRMALQLDLDRLGAERAQEPRAARRGQEPREVEDADLVQRKRLAARRQPFAHGRARRGIDHRQVALTRKHHGRRILVQERRAPAHGPGRARREPLARGVAERATELGVLDVGAAPAREPVWIHRVLVRLAQGRPQHAGLLGFAPRHVVVGERPHEALDGLHGVVALLRARSRARHEPSARRQGGLLGVEPGVHAVLLEQGDELRGFTRARSQVRHHPAAVLRVHDGRMRRDALARVAAGLAQHERTAHHPGHQVDLGGFRHRLVNGARHPLPLPRTPAEQQGGDDRQRELLAGDVVGVPHLRGDRRQIVRAAGRRIVAAVHHHAAERQVDQVRALEVGPRAVIAEGRHPRDDQGGGLLQQRARAEAARLEFASWGRLQQDVRGGDQRADPIAVVRPVQVEHDRALPPVVLPEEQRALAIFPIFVEGPDTARGATARRLDLDHVGAEPRQGQPAVLRLLVGQLDDADACERTSGTLVLGVHGDFLQSGRAHPTACVQWLAPANISRSHTESSAVEQRGNDAQRLRHARFPSWKTRRWRGRTCRACTRGQPRVAGRASPLELATSSA